MWVADEGAGLLVQAGPWLQSMALFPAGIAPRHTRLLGTAPAAVVPGIDGSSATVLLATSSSRPSVETLPVDAPDQQVLTGEPDELRDYWRERLNLSLDSDANVSPIIDQSATLSETEPKNYQ
jgi:hypothetical protein